MMAQKKLKILISGTVDYSPIGRHALSFIAALAGNDLVELYIDPDYLNAESRHILSERFAALSYRFHDNDRLIYDFVIFTYVLGLYPDEMWHQKCLTKKARKRICYPVFDGSVPPLEWANRINSDFDICLTPSQYCARNLVRYGVRIACTHLECAVLIDELLDLHPADTSGNGKFRFGCISAHETRKNLPFLIASFAETFAGNENVELFIHTFDRNDLTCPMDELLATYRQYAKDCHIRLSTGFMPQSEIIRLWSTFQAYICPQSATGYFTTPVEAMAAGIPCILSDIPVHRELENNVKTENNLFFVAHRHVKPLMHCVFDYRMTGIRIDSEKSLYRNAMLEVYDRRHELLTPRRIIERKESARQFNAINLRKKYFGILVAYTKTARKALAENTTPFEESETATSHAISDKAHIRQDSENMPGDTAVKIRTIEDISEASQRLYITKYLRNRPRSGKNKYLDKMANIASEQDIGRFLLVPYLIMKLYGNIKKLIRN